MDWSEYLEAEEVLRWEGRPAPRAFTFRNWRSSLFGFLLLFLSIYWQLVGVQLKAVYDTPAVDFLPVPFMLCGLWMAVGQVMLARLEWERVFYAVTDSRILALHGFFSWRVESLPLEELNYFDKKPLGENLATLRVSAGKPPRALTLFCLEYPDILGELLENVLMNRGLECRATEQ